MNTSLESLRSLLRENVAEISFVRRRPRPGKPPVRRMLCTLSDKILNSENGRLSLNYKSSSGVLPYNTTGKNLLPVWDIFMQDWRMVSLDNCNVLTTYNEEQFWKYFNEKLILMSAAEKILYMDS